MTNAEGNESVTEVPEDAMYGRRGGGNHTSRIVHAIRNDAFARPIVARCGRRITATVGQDQPVTCADCRSMLAVDADQLNAPYASRIAAAEEAIASAGFTLRYVDACEGDGVGGLIGMGMGVTIWDRREVRIRTMLTGASLARVLEHELDHVEERPGYERGTHNLLSKGA
jgi:hypothetical protein